MDRKYTQMSGKENRKSLKLLGKVVSGFYIAWLVMSASKYGRIPYSADSSSVFSSPAVMIFWSSSGVTFLVSTVSRPSSWIF